MSELVFRRGLTGDVVPPHFVCVSTCGWIQLQARALEKGSGSKNRCVLLEPKLSRSSGRIASRVARFTESGHRLNRETDSISGASGEGSVERTAAF